MTREEVIRLIAEGREGFAFLIAETDSGALVADLITALYTVRGLEEEKARITRQYGDKIKEQEALIRTLLAKLEEPKEETLPFTEGEAEYAEEAPAQSKPEPEPESKALALLKGPEGHEEGGDACPDCGHPWAAHYDAEGNARPCVLKTGPGVGTYCGCRAGYADGEAGGKS